MCPEASTVLAASLARRRPIFAMRPFLMPMSPRKRGIRVPSMTIPSLMMRSYSGMGNPPVRVTPTLSEASHQGTLLSRIRSSHWNSSGLRDAGLDLDVKRHQDTNHHVIECYILYDFHQAAGIEEPVQRLEGRIAHGDIHRSLESVPHDDAFLIVKQPRRLEFVEMLELFAGDPDAAREVPMVRELVLRAREPTDRHQRELAQFGIERGAIAKLAAQREEASQQIGRMGKHPEDVADRSFALLDEAIENLAIRFGKIFTIEIRQSRHDMTPVRSNGW